MAPAGVVGGGSTIDCPLCAEEGRSTGKKLKAKSVKNHFLKQHGGYPAKASKDFQKQISDMLAAARRDVPG